ncbi:DUF1049 domain-containing protein [Roseiconus nitratireducens]|uniref:DUF1049 domain-containing protein n=1 Tax=Roseiconus nitratireducens TaxID=2605748 RepID=A0A5M6D5W7_9BACT|nr:DUF1049 domain-containing protein [Roseiconus nitratireducens]KAA5542136.1 DUF1049 domain-containing protein [Roseiconus nitratireducens]
MHYVTTGLAVIALLAIVIFAVQNLAGVEVTFLVWSATISKCIVIIGAYVLGMITGWGLVGLFRKSLQK